MSFPQSREEYDVLVAELEARGFTVLTRWRKGLKRIRLGDIVLSEEPVMDMGHQPLPAELQQAIEAQACDEPVWDGPYRMSCSYAIVDGRCVRHGENGRKRPAARRSEHDSDAQVSVLEPEPAPGGGRDA